MNTSVCFPSITYDKPEYRKDLGIELTTKEYMAGDYGQYSIKFGGDKFTVWNCVDRLFLLF